MTHSIECNVVTSAGLVDSSMASHTCKDSPRKAAREISGVNVLLCKMALK